MKAPKDFEKKRLNSTNVEEYLKKKFNTENVEQISSKVLNIIPLLQNNYGEAGDCTLTSITTCVNYYKAGQTTIQEIYDYVEKVAKKWGYNGNIGTFPLFIQRIYNEVLKKFPCTKKRTAQRYLKNVGFNFNTIKNTINKSTPIVLSINNDGRNYYKNHSITIIGYKMFKVNKRTVNMLVVYDNWYASESYVDWDALPIIASINY